MTHCATSKSLKYLGAQTHRVRRCQREFKRYQFGAGRHGSLSIRTRARSVRFDRRVQKLLLLQRAAKPGPGCCHGNQRDWCSLSTKYRERKAENCSTLVLELENSIMNGMWNVGNNFGWICRCVISLTQMSDVWCLTVSFTNCTSCLICNYISNLD